MALFRYRGHGNPGPTVVETTAGERFTKSYLEMWEDESGWDVETRCKLCPDALGEAADVAAADVWPGGAPTGEDAGFNGIIVRTAVGEDLVASAVEAGELVLGDPITPPGVRRPPAAPGAQEGGPGRSLPGAGRRGRRPHRDKRPANPRARPANRRRAVRT